ncbi:MAG: hypothetical protein AAGL66_05945 [Pseudomonadota bacterium]
MSDAKTEQWLMSGSGIEREGNELPATEEPRLEEEPRLDRGVALRHVLVFQLKLAADALRDFLLSPVSLAAFTIDALRQPPVSKSYYLRLMRLGRRSDHMINLFGSRRSGARFSIDRAVDDLEVILRRATRDAACAERSSQAAGSGGGQHADS